ncbi:MAG: inositol-3-phosphate synthase [Thermoguttaceae bacterium]|nr:inositol-3-phosphate synthase [Thermoguttaceae bacterium]MDW8078953.1 inositol-3-phosphate synthase [Thermoguttaceae bacterium]
MAAQRYGVWLVGACGGVASTATLGLIALKHRAIPTWGLVTELPRFAALPLPGWEEFVVGGHEIRPVVLVDELRQFARHNRAFEPGLVDAYEAELTAVQPHIRWGTVWGATEAIRKLAGPDVPEDHSACQAIERIETDLRQFQEEHRLEHLVVIHVASTEPPIPKDELPRTWAELWPWLSRKEATIIPPSCLYAIAAFRAGCSYINFTPSVGPDLPAITELALQRRCRYMGCDGKTGETLLKSVLAPLFAQRNLRVLSWVGYNIFGNLDARILDHPAHKTSKLTTKDQLLGEVLGYKPQTHVSIELVESLGDWKTAWDHVHFAGFFGTKMVLHFIWQGCDSVLAAPLVLDLARWSILAWKRGEVGLMPFLASYFKSPYGVSQQDFFAQFQLLESWALGPQAAKLAGS